MDDGYSGIHMLTLIVLVVLEAVLYGFGAALQELGGGLEEEARDGNRKAEKILALAERPGRLVSGAGKHHGRTLRGSPFLPQPGPAHLVLREQGLERTGVRMDVGVPGLF